MHDEWTLFSLPRRNSRNEIIHDGDEEEQEIGPSDLVPDDQQEALMVMSLAQASNESFEKLYYETRRSEVHRRNALIRALNYSAPSKPS